MNTTISARASLERKLRTNGACNCFEEALRAKNLPRIEAFLADAPEADRSELLAELLELELECLRKDRSNPNAADYRERFPEYHEVIAAAFSPSAEAPRFIGKHRVVKKLGEGSFGQVFLAEQHQVRRWVAVKVPHQRLIPTDTASREAFVTRFLEEGRRLGQLKHGNIVLVHTADRDEQFGCFLVMKYVDGESLCRRIKDGPPFAVSEATRLVAEVARAVEHAHQKGVVHRDLKPANILIDRQDRPQVTDFGLSLDRFRSGYQDQHTAGTPAYSGTPAYMAPEQWQGDVQRQADGKADVWTLGVILYELLTGRRPLADEDRSTDKCTQK